MTKIRTKMKKNKIIIDNLNKLNQLNLNEPSPRYKKIKFEIKCQIKQLTIKRGRN